MLDYPFIANVGKLIKTYQHFPTPVLLIDRSWHIHWGNHAARLHCPQLLTKPKRQLPLSNAERETAFRHTQETGNHTIDSSLLLTGSCPLSFSPIYDDNGQVAGMVSIFLRGSSVSEQGCCAALSYNIRETASHIFDYLDAGTTKVEMMNADWIKPTFGQISSEGCRMLRIANNLNEFQSYKQLKTPGNFNRAVVDLEILFQQIRPLLADFADMSGIPIELEEIPYGVYVEMNLPQFETAFYNLLHNSLSYTKPGNRICVSSEVDGRDLYLHIKDRGLGIPLTILDKMLKPYQSYRHDAIRTGSGLGLTIASLFAASHGGSFQLESTAGQGTTATLVLPIIPFTKPLPLAQRLSSYRSAGQFSAVYVGLFDAVFQCRN